ncbi:MAG: fibronectin type III domain-containing protein, partial [Chryseobacterium sp.]|nr:fibronectin type III domain-containing protein [Candidatus Chryseobacterium enterohippi]
LFSKNATFNGKLKNLSLGLALLLGCAGANAQVSSYAFAQSTGTYTSLTGGNPIATATASTGTGSLYNIAPVDVAIPFPFNFNGKVHNSLVVSSNGFVTFGSTLPLNTTTLPLSYIGAYDGAISAWGRSNNSFFNVASRTGDISTHVEGSAPNREFVIQWKDSKPIYSISTTIVYGFSYQIRLREGTNTIAMVYDNGSYAAGTAAISGTAQIGLRGYSPSDFNNRLNATTLAFGSSTVGTAATSTQAFNTSAATPGMPASGLTYTWTPPSCFTPKSISIGAITTNNATISWTAPFPAPANGYDVYYSTSPDAPTSTTTPTFSSITGTSVQLSSLLPNMQYFVWVRSKCSATDYSAWSVEENTFSTLCGPASNYYTGFEGYTAGAYLPTCWNRLVSATNTGTLTTSVTTPAAGLKGMYMYTSSSTSTIYTPSIAVLPEFNNLNAGTHWLRFRSRITTAGSGTLQAGYITNVTDMATFVPLEDIPVTNIAWSFGTDEKFFIPPTTIPAGARLALRTVNDGKYFYIDELYWEAKPTCYAPTTISSSAVTANTITLNWNAATPVPANGYEVYYSTSNTWPTSSTIPSVTGIMTTSTVLSNLTPVTKYYVWVRSKCSATDISSWSSPEYTFLTECQPPLFTATGASFCSGNTATLNATSDAGNMITWYDSATAGNQLATGNTYTTPALTSTTNYWVSAKQTQNVVGGKSTVVSTTGNTGLAVGLIIDAFKDIVINTVDVYPYTTTAANAGPGTITVSLVNAAGTVLQSNVFNVNVTNTAAAAATAPPSTIQLNYNIPAGSGYKLLLAAKSTEVTGLLRESETSNFSFPYIIGNLCELNTTTSSYYYYFYNLNVSGPCESPRQQVTATLDSACLGTSEATKKNEIKVYPNPFHDVISISDIANVKSLSVMDISGRVVRTIENVSANSINLSELKEGMYILQLHYKDGSTSSQKVIKK